MVQKHEWIISAREEGFEQAAQRVTRSIATMAEATQALERIGTQRPSAFAELTSPEQEALLRTSIRDVDNLAAALQRLRNAEQARTDIRSKAAIESGQPGGFKTDRQAEIALGRANIAVNQAAKALGVEWARTMAELQQTVQAEQRKAILGPSVAVKGQPFGPLQGARDQLSQAAEDGKRAAAIEAKRIQEEDIAAREAIGKRNAIEARRTQEEDLAAREEIGKRKAIEAKRTQEEDLAARELNGKRIAIMRKRMEEEDLAAREANGKRIAIQRKRIEQEDMAAREEIGRQNAISRKRMEAEDLQAREEIGRRNAISRKRMEAEDLALREELGRQHRITQRRQEAADLAAYIERGQMAEGQRQQGIYQGFQPTYTNPDLDTRLGRAENNVNRAERALEVATLARTKVLNSGIADAAQLHRSEQSVISANTALAAARRAVAVEQARSSTFRGQFMAGFRGASDRPYAEQLGQAFKFSVFYGTAYKLLFALTQTFQQTLQEGIEFESAMTELKIASGQSAEAATKMSQSLQQQATAAGQAPSTGVLIGARSLGLFGATESAGASKDEQQRVMDISARVVSRMALGSKLPIEEIQTQLAAVANAFDGGAAGQIRAYDLDAYLGRQFGVMQGQILQAVAESANVGQAAGFDQEQISAIAAAMISRTGQSPSTASGWMAQMFSRGGEGSLTAVTQRYGIDANLELADQIAQLAQVYKTANSTERNQILSSFGRGKVQNAAEVLLGGWDEINKAADRSRTEAPGEGDRVSEMRLADIGGQIQLTVAAMKDFASAFGKSGLLSVVGAGVVALREMVEAVTALVRVWNGLDGAIKGAIVGLGLLAVAARTGAASSVLGFIGGLGARSAAGSGVNLAQVMAPYGGVANPAGLTPGIGMGAASGARAALATAGPWIAAAAGLYALGELVGSTKALKTAQEDATKALNSAPLGPDATADDIRNRAAEFTQNATTTREAADKSWMNKVLPSSRQAAAGLREDADSMDQEARRLQANAKIIENAAADMAAGSTSLISGFDKDGLAASLDILTNSGYSASERMSILSDAIAGTGAAAASAAAQYDPKLFAAQNADPLTALLGESITGIDGKPMTPDAVRNALGGVTGDPNIGIMQALGGAGIGGFEDFDIKGATKAAEALVQQTEGTQSYIGTEEYNTAVEKVRDYLLGQTRQAYILVDAAAKLTPEEGMNNMNAFIAMASQLDSNTQETDYRGRIRNQRRLVQNLRRNLARTPGAGEEMTLALDAARRELAQRQFEELENMRRAAQRNAKSRAEVAQIGRRFLRRELRAAIRGGNQDLMAEIIGQAGGAAVRIARNILQEAINAANAARAAYLKFEALQREAMSLIDGAEEFVRGGVPGKLPPRNTQAETALGNLGSMQTAGDWEDDVYSSGSDVPGFEPPKDPAKGKSAEDKKAEREAARQAMLELKNNLYLLSIDMTDPLQMAVAAVKDARRRLKSDLGSGQDRNTIAADRVALRQAQAEREATAFQQRLDAVTTAEELGRISHQKYISYLESERKRLGAIKDRTFQQQQQLDQIDRLMKDAAEQMQGQWNFGDIKLPTPYQVRRQVEAMRTDRASSLDATSRQVQNNSTIYIDGADTGKVRQIIADTLGKANATVTNRPRRR